MEKNDKGSAACGRREFLRGAGLGALGAATATAAGPVEPAAAEAAQAAPAGYRETNHVKKYYAAAKRF